MYEYEGTLVRVVDGDTCILNLSKAVAVDVDFGFYVKDKVSLTKTAVVDFRLKGINCPEMKGATKKAGQAAKDMLQILLHDVPLRVISYKTDKYGRWLAEIFIKDKDGVEKSVNALMIEGGFAVPFMTD